MLMFYIYIKAKQNNSNFHKCTDDTEMFEVISFFTEVCELRMRPPPIYILKKMMFFFQQFKAMRMRSSQHWILKKTTNQVWRWPHPNLSELSENHQRFSSNTKCNDLLNLHPTFFSISAKLIYLLKLLFQKSLIHNASRLEPLLYKI